MKINKIYIALLTKFASEGGTDSGGYIAIEIGGQQVFIRNFPDTPLDDLEPGRAQLFQFDANNLDINLNDLTESSIRIGIRGDDSWTPEYAFVWFEAFKNPLMLAPYIYPIAMSTKITTRLSTDTSEGTPAIGLKLVSKGGNDMVIKRLLLLVQTDFMDDPGLLVEVNPDFFGGKLELLITTKDKLVVHTEIGDTDPNYLGNGEANYFQPHVIFPFKKSELHEKSIVINRKYRSVWRPKCIFLFGLNQAESRPTSVVPLLYLPDLSIRGNYYRESTTDAIRFNEPPVNEGVINPGELSR